MANNPNVTYRKVNHVHSTKELLARAKEEVGDKIAYRYFVGADVESATYAEFYDRVMALGAALAELGHISSHIAMIGANSYDYITLYLTILAGDGVFVPVDKELPPEEYLHVIADSDATIVFCDEKYEETLRENGDKIPKVTHIVNLSRTEDDGKCLSFAKLLVHGYELEKQNPGALLSHVRNPEDLALLVYTSGTTGLAKGVMLSEKNLLSCACYGLEISTIYDTGLSILPYHHTYEAVTGILVAILYHSTLCINDNLRHVLRNLQLFKPDYIYVVPAFAEMFYKKIWSNAKASGKEFFLKAAITSSNGLRKIGVDKRASLFKNIHEAFGGNLKMIVCGGAPLRPELGAFFDSIGIPIYNGYGITECSPLVSVNQSESNDCSTVGMPLRCVNVTIEDPDEDGNGEICVKGDTVMLGYYKRPDLTAEVLMPEGTFHTGDFGRFNEKGQLLITGRKKNLIVLDNGKNIFPEEIENYLSGIPYVQDVLVFGIKNAEGEEVALGAEIFLSEEKVKELKVTEPEAALKKDIAKVCRHLPSYKRISKIFIRDIPFEKTTTNKIKRSSSLYAFAPVKTETEA